MFFWEKSTFLSETRFAPHLMLSRRLVPLPSKSEHFFFEQPLWTVTLPLKFNYSNLVRQIWILNAPVHQPWSVGHDRTLDWPYLNDKHLTSTRFHRWSRKKLNSAHFNKNQKACHKNINIEVFCVFSSLTQAPCICEQRTAPNSKHVGAPQMSFSTTLSHKCACPWTHAWQIHPV